MLRLTALFLLLLVSIAHAQITLDGSMGVAGALTGPNFVISSNRGQTRGSNLFHSFGLFNVLTGQSATFTGPNSISNVFGRVTGGQPSNIDGTIRLTIPNANLYLMNPAGMLFGPNASLDVHGSFHVTTADYLKFADGAKFHAELSRQSTLTSAPVSAFGFLSSSPAPVLVQSSLRLPDEAVLSFIGGNVVLDGATVSINAGQSSIASVASPGEVPVDIRQLNMSSFARFGAVSLSGFTIVDVSGNGGGSVVIRGGQLLFDASFIVADNLGPRDGIGPGVDIHVTGASTISGGSIISSHSSFFAGRARDVHITAGSLEMDNSAIDSFSFDSGDAGNISISAGALAMTGGGFPTAQISSSAFASGNAGNIAIQAKNLRLTSGAQLASDTSGAGNSGAIKVAITDTLALDGAESLITTQSNIGSHGNAGDISIAAKNIAVTRGARIESASSGSGNAGAMEIKASDLIRLDGIGVIPSGIYASTSSASTGKANDISVEAKNISLTNGAQISSATFGSGDGGAVQLSATEAVTLGASSLVTASSSPRATGKGGNVLVDAKQVVLTNGSQISSGTFGSGNGGTVRVTASDSITVDGVDAISPSGILANSEIGSSGDAGNVIVEAKTLTVTGGAQILGITAGAGDGGTVRVTTSESISLDGVNKNPSGIIANAERMSSGNGGNIIVQTKNLTVTGGAQIASGTFSSGNGGTVQVTATESIAFDGLSTFASGISTAVAPGSTGRAGNILVAGKNLTLTGGAQISSGTFGSGNGGAVEVNASDTIRIEGSSGVFRSAITAATDRGSTGNAGSVNVNARNVIVIEEGAIGTGTAGTGSGGTVRISASEAIDVARGGRISSNSTNAGAGGSIDVRAQRISLLDGASISAISSATGNAGNIDIVAAEGFRSVNSAVTTAAETADGGNIHLHVGKLIELQNSQITATVRGGQGQGGNITIDPTFLVMNHSQITADAFGGPGGNITIVADNFLASADSTITASSALSTPGTIDIQAPIIDLSGSLTPLPDAIVQASSLLRQSCGARYSGGKLSSLASYGRGGMPFEPGIFFASSLLSDAESGISWDLGRESLVVSTPSKFSIVSPCVTLY